MAWSKLTRDVAEQREENVDREVDAAPDLNNRVSCPKSISKQLEAPHLEEDADGRQQDRANDHRYVLESESPPHLARFGLLLSLGEVTVPLSLAGKSLLDWGARF